MSRAGEPIVAAYEQTGAASAPCSHCGADTGDWCRDYHGRTTRVPCVARIAAAGLRQMPAPDIDVPVALDFAEPRRPREVDG